MRLEGRTLHRGWWGAQTLFRGKLKVGQRYDAETHRYSVQAWMTYSEHQDVAELGTLYDAKLLWIDGDAMCFTGFEREAMMNREYMQSWLVRAIPAELAMTAPAPTEGATRQEAPSGQRASRDFETDPE